MNNKGSSLTPAQALEKLNALYEQSVNALRCAISEYIETGKLPDDKARNRGLFVYPSLSVTSGRQRQQHAENPCLCALYPLRLLQHYGDPPCTVSSLSRRTAHAAVPGLRRAHFR